MKLKQIKLAGFKSFVDPTKIPFTKALTGVVGPNGCGKSNVIDAVRWVLGESSAKHLRGGSMADVIFSGSNARKPVSVASVELSFENQDGRLAGQYSSYQEISVKRQVSRDGDSFYFLNGQKCRRKDITDVFMGTGLGPRSYAIIEQGMISRLIESKPQDLRVFIEEAAGISRYKERRRDTENRIRHTRENLERLFDIRNELETQLKKLASQSKSALKYRELKQQERKVHAELLVLKYQEHTSIVDEITVKINQFMLELEKVNAEIESLKSQATKLSLDLSDLNVKEQHQVDAFYLSGTEIARLEQQKTHQQQLDKKLLVQLEKTEQQKVKFDSELQTLFVNRSKFNDEVDELSIDRTFIQEQMGELTNVLENVQLSYASKSDLDKELRLKLNDAKMQSQLQQSQQKHHQHNLIQLNEQLDQLKLQRDSFVLHQNESNVRNDELKLLNEEIAVLEQQLVLAKKKCDSIELNVSDLKQQQKESDTLITEFSSRIKVIDEWINEHKHSTSPIWEVIKVKKGWENPVELLIGHLLTQEFISDDVLDSRCGFIQAETEFKNEIIINSKVDLSPWFSNVRFIESKLQALVELEDNKSILYLTKDGYLLGDGFVIEQQNVESSQLSLQSEKTDLHRELSSSLTLLAIINEQLATALQEQNINTDSLENIKNDLKQSELKRSSVLSKIAALAEQQTKDEVRKQEVESQIHVAQKKIDDLANSSKEELQKAHTLTTLVDKFSSELLIAENSLHQTQSELEQVRNKINELQTKLNAEQLSIQDKQTQLAVCDQQLSQTQLRTAELSEQLIEIRNALNPDDKGNDITSPQMLKKQLTELVEKHNIQQKELTCTRQSQTQLQEQLQDITIKQKSVIGVQDKAVQQISELKLKREGIKGQINSQLGILNDEKVDIQLVITALPHNAEINQWHNDLDSIKQRIARLGAINLTAIEEYEQQKERKDYLDKQNDDLTTALESLESAIKKIDRETKIRFKDTYEKVNNDLQTLFPKVFGGGSAYLELTDDDLLETGITIMARPPGKKNSTIHLLSGGEKALTALSLVFAIFRLNPAPFCMLDEVDAPLDDANVVRFCRLLEEMSQTVQFIYISHNKITMEMADQLIGVTMHEPGVSRIVAVDVDEAVALADVG